MSEKELSRTPSGPGGVPRRTDEISTSPEPLHTPAKDGGVAYSSTPEKGPEVSEKPQDYAAHEKSLDEESGNVGQISDSASARRRQKWAVWNRRLRPVVHFLIWALWTM